MPYLALDTVTVADQEGTVNNHLKDTVLSDWEVSDHIQKLISDGNDRTRLLLEPLTPREAEHHRRKATKLEGSRSFNGEVIEPPFDDYVGLHPQEVCDRMRTMDVEGVKQVKNYERGGLRRLAILNYVAPSEREPWEGFTNAGVRDILEKFSIMSDKAVQEAIVYEMGHNKRPAIISYERDLYEPEGADVTAGASSVSGGDGSTGSDTSSSGLVPAAGATQ